MSRSTNLTPPSDFIRMVAEIPTDDGVDIGVYVQQRLGQRFLVVDGQAIAAEHIDAFPNAAQTAARLV